MPHSYNQAAFKTVVNPTNPLLAIYATLVEIELALKDMEFAASGNWRQGHKLVEWIAALGEASAAEALRDELATLVCTDRTGQQARVEANKYPDLRYLRHAQDFPEGSDDQMLQTTLDVVSTTRALLRARGVSLQ